MDRHSYTIGCLSLSAVVMLVGVLVLAGLETQRAEASDMLSTAGPYMLLTGAVSPSNDLIYLIDTRKGILLVYKINETTRAIERTDLIHFGEAADNDMKRPPLKP